MSMWTVYQENPVSPKEHEAYVQKKIKSAFSIPCLWFQ